MKRPTIASLKKVTPENLAALGADRLAEILVAAALNRPELKRRLRMELAAEQGADHLLTEIDKRLGSLETSRSKVSWRQRPTFVRDLDALRILIAQRLAGLDHSVALDRIWRFMALAGRLAGRVRDRDGELAGVFARAAGDVGCLLEASGGVQDAEALVEAVIRNPGGWTGWLPVVLERSPPELARIALATMSRRDGAAAAWMLQLRQLADAANDVDAYRATFSNQALRTPEVAAQVAERLLASDRVEEAGKVLQATTYGGPGAPRSRAQSGDLDFNWETVWIDYLERSGQEGAAQEARWSSFARTLSPERLRAFTRRLADFDDVEAEERAFQHAAAHRDLSLALGFLIDWPALPEAAALIQARPASSGAVLEPQAEAWAERLRARQPKAAGVLLRIAAQSAYRRRDRAAGERLTLEADALGPPSAAPAILPRRAAR